MKSTTLWKWKGYVDTFVGNAWGCRCVFFLCVHEERHEPVNCRHWNIASVVPREQSFAFQVQEKDCRGHDGRQTFRALAVQLTRFMSHRLRPMTSRLVRKQPEMSPTRSNHFELKFGRA